MNDLPCASNCYTTLFADNTNLLFEHHCIKTLQSEVSREMIKLENWMKSNKLTINYSKSCFMIICENSVNVDDFKLTIQNNSTEKTKSVKYLGVYVDNELTKKIYIDYIGKKTFKSMWRNL